MRSFEQQISHLEDKFYFEHEQCTEVRTSVTSAALLKIKVLQDAIEEPFCLNGSIKNL